MAEVTSIQAYRQVDIAEPPIEKTLVGVVSAYLLVTSPNIARRLVAGLTEAARAEVSAGRWRIVAISKQSAGVVREAGLPVVAVAVHATEDGLIDAVISDKRINAGG